MSRNIKSGVHLTIVSKLREGGKSEAEAKALADANVDAGLSFLNNVAADNASVSGGLEASYDKAFEELRDWAEALA